MPNTKEMKGILLYEKYEKIGLSTVKIMLTYQKLKKQDDAFKMETILQKAEEKRPHLTKLIGEKNKECMELKEKVKL